MPVTSFLKLPLSFSSSHLTMTRRNCNRGQKRGFLEEKKQAFTGRKLSKKRISLKTHKHTHTHTYTHTHTHSSTHTHTPFLFTRHLPKLTKEIFMVCWLHTLHQHVCQSVHLCLLVPSLGGHLAVPIVHPNPPNTPGHFSHGNLGAWHRAVLTQLSWGGFRPVWLLWWWGDAEEHRKGLVLLVLNYKKSESG